MGHRGRPRRVQIKTHQRRPAATLTEFDRSELLEAIKAGELTERIRASLEWILQELIEAEATARIGAGRYERSEERTTQRNGYRRRLLSTPAGDVELGAWVRTSPCRGRERLVERRLVTSASMRAQCSRTAWWSARIGP